MKKLIYGVGFMAFVTAGIIFFKVAGTHSSIQPTILAIEFQLPEGYAFTEKAPFVLTWRNDSSKGLLSVPTMDPDFNPFMTPYRLACMPTPGAKEVILNARLYYCQKTSRMCFQGDFETRIPLHSKTISTIPWVWKIIPKQTGD